ncbi:MAG: translocation/assembly module TamB domain-containing protein [Bacteroidales bacterium]|nr:translocation/assembly module TamB domain-containing protein [Bacteroidales bacterium]
MQSYLTKQTIKFFANHYDIALKVDNVYIKLPNKIVLSKIEILDASGDTLLLTNEIDAKITLIRIFASEIYLDQITLSEPQINVIVDTTGVANYEYILNKFTSEKTEPSNSKGFDIFCNNFEIIDAKLSYRDLREPPDNGIFNPANIAIKGLNIQLSDFKFYNDSLELDINKFTLSEKSGLDIKELSGHLKYCDTAINISNFALLTKNSQFKCSVIEAYGDDASYLLDPINKMTVEVNIDTLVFDVADLGPFMSEYRHLHDKISISGNFKGKLSKFKFKKFQFAYGEDTKMTANLSVDGLPNYDMTFVFGDVSEFTTSDRDIRRIIRLSSPKTYTPLPSVINEIGNISFTGNITGLFSDLVAYGEFNTGLGSLNTDIAIVTDFEEKKINYNGTVNAYKFNLGKITGNPATFGNLSLNSKITGVVDSTGNFAANIDCKVSELEILGYNYTGIILNGDVSNVLFDGELFINDPNLQVEFLGKYKYGGKDQYIDFSTDISANLNGLNITNDSLESELNLALACDMSGDLLSRPVGNLYLSQLNFVTKGKSLKLNQLSFNSFIDEYDQQYFTLRSDYVDMNFYGSFLITELAQEFYNILASYVPSFLGNPLIFETTSDNTANFDIRLKRLNNFTRIYLPELDIESDIFAEGMFSGKEKRFDAIFSIPVIKYDSIYLWGNEFNINGYKDSLDINLTMQEISSRKFPWFENINLNLDIAQDSLTLGLNWDNFSEIRNAGNIKIGSKFFNKDTVGLPRIENIIHNSEVIVENKLWEISKTPITVDGQEVTINYFSLTHEDQVLNIDGVISSDKSKLLRFLINNVDISNFNTYISNTGYEFHGILSGNGRVANIYDVPSLRSSLSINDFKINNEDFGRFDLSAIWEGESNGFKVDGVNKYMKLRGSYSPETDILNANLTVDNFKLEILQPYLLDLEISELSGAVDIVLNVEGSFKEPKLSGEVSFEKAEFMYDMLKLKAYTDDKVLITNDAILFQNFKIYDEKANKGSINGGIYHNNFKDIFIDLRVDATKMKLLNTTEKDNNTYYGTAYATGNVKISGTLDNFGIDVVAKTEPNTVFVLPMSESYEGGNISYVTFIQPAIDSADNQSIKSLASKTDYYFKMDIEVTPDAEAQIVFDPKVGDLISAFCQGNLKMEYNSDEEFYMYGELEVVEGDYLFTLENIINKKFHVKPGGSIVWSGSAYDAIIDIDAIYNTRAPLKDLMAALSDSSDIYNKPVNVECQMHMSGNLMTPDIQFSITVPNANDKAKAQLANLTQDEINKQLLYLLIMNRFYNPNQSAGMGNEMGSTTNAFGVTSSELLSNQVSNWLSQISKDFDIGFNYRPGTEMSGKELEVALSTQILNDRVLINGNVGLGENRANTSNLVGDIEVQLKVNKKGSFRVKGFTRANDDLEAEFGPYTNGVGIFYTDDFNTFGELFTRFWHGITFKKTRDKRKAKESLNKESETI